jgi:hypothetical protein
LCCSFLGRPHIPADKHNLIKYGVKFQPVKYHGCPHFYALQPGADFFIEEGSLDAEVVNRLLPIQAAPLTERK